MIIANLPVGRGFTPAVYASHSVRICTRSAGKYHALLARHIDTPQGVHIEREAHIEFALSTKQIYRREASLRLLGHKKDEEPFLILRLFY